MTKGEREMRDEEMMETESARIVNAGVIHLFITVFLTTCASCMILPEMTDVTMSAICPGRLDDNCPLVVYLTGLQHSIIGLGNIVMIPLIANLSDYYGRKTLLTLPIILRIFPLAILAYGRTKSFFYAYYVLHTIIAMISEGSILSVALAYMADNVSENRRAAVFGIMAGIFYCTDVLGNFSASLFSTSSNFQIATAMAFAAAVYMRIFLPESNKLANDHSLRAKLIERDGVVDSKEPNMDTSLTKRLLKGFPSLGDTTSLLRTSTVFSQAVVISLLNSLGDVGLQTSLLYYLKVRFHFGKNQYANYMIIGGLAGSTSQLLIMPLLVPLLGEEKLLSLSLLFNFLHMVLYSIAWSSWVTYVCAAFFIFTSLSQPCLRSIVSKQVGPTEQGKAQGCISGLSSIANVISPIIFTPLTALFLSEDAPFNFPGFSILCYAFTLLVALVLSLTIWKSRPMHGKGVTRCNSVA